jgi:2-keto-4-pentenoate hydratase/2-oxohepta-3-ene-1,7-dioic acid hydratase in catechol pathway
VRIGRVGIGDASWIARIEDDTVTPLLAAPNGLGRDGLRDALAAGVDVATVPAAGEPVALDQVRLLSPVTAPSKVLAIGLNYADHARESGLEPPAAPVSFVKTNNSIVGPGDEIRYAKDDTSEVDYEAELAVVIGRRAQKVSEAAALDYVFGYTACNDVSARDAQFSDGQWIRGKSFDTFCPLGPWIVTADEIPDPQNLRIACRVNGTTLQDGTTSEMIFGVAAIISYMSRFMTLEPGDVIATGTPYGVGFARTPPVFLLNGDVVEIDIEGIGVLTNSVVVE